MTAGTAPENIDPEAVTLHATAGRSHRTSRPNGLSFVLGTAAATGIGMIPLHRLPRPVRLGYVVLPAAFASGALLLALQRGAPRREKDGDLGERPVPSVPSVSQTALCLAVGGLTAGAGLASLRIDRSIENLLRRRGVRAPRVWMGLASGALSLASTALEMRMTADREELEDGVLELLSESDPMELDPGLRGGTPADEYQPEAEAIAAFLRVDGTVTAAHLDEVWQEWFDQPLTPLLGEERLEALADELRALVAPAPAG